MHGSMNNFEQECNRTWRLVQDTLDVEKCITKYFMRVQIDKVPVHILSTVSVFYICEHCGKIYWKDLREEKIMHNILGSIIIPSVEF